MGDSSLENLQNYRPTLVNKSNIFDSFWDKEKIKINEVQLQVKVEWRDYPSPNVEVADITLISWDSTPLSGILVKPKGTKECPVTLCFPGYTGGCGLAVDYLKWTTLDTAVLAFDVRGQGNSPDYAKYPNGSGIPGWMLYGLKEPENYYYTNVYRDIMLQLSWVRSNDFPIQLIKLGVMGSSQGGGLALVAAGLDKNMDFVMSDWPFLTHFNRAIDIALSGPYMEIVNYFKWNDPDYSTYEDVMKTLGYIDSVHFCESITCPTLMAVGLKDSKTPPLTVFAAFNHLESVDKVIEVYPQFTHEANPFHEEKKLAFLMNQLQK